MLITSYTVFYLVFFKILKFLIEVLPLVICVFSPQSNLSEVGSSAGCSQSCPAGVKLEVVMEHLQKQQEAKLEMSLQEKQLLHAQLLFAQQAAAARASFSRPDSTLFERVDGQSNPALQQALNNHLSGVDPEAEEDGNSEDEEQEMLTSQENNEEEDMGEEEEEEEENNSHQQAKKPRLQHVSHFPFQPYSTSPSAAGKQTSESPPSGKKQEHMEKNLTSPAGHHAFTSANGFADWGFDESVKRVREKMHICNCYFVCIRMFCLNC